MFNWVRDAHNPIFPRPLRTEGWAHSYFTNEEREEGPYAIAPDSKCTQGHHGHRPQAPCDTGLSSGPLAATRTLGPLLRARALTEQRSRHLKEPCNAFCPFHSQIYVVLLAGDPLLGLHALCVCLTSPMTASVAFLPPMKRTRLPGQRLSGTFRHARSGLRGG